MDIGGIWKGEYRGSFEGQPTFVKATFIMKIKVSPTQDQHVIPAVYFEGISQDHPDESLITQHANVIGSFINGDIYFIKQYPKLMLQSSLGKIEQHDQPHPEIHYTGKLENGTFRGRWHVDVSFRKINGEIRMFNKMDGIWEMERI